ncbi:MAG: ATP-binding protein [Desulfatitalea sp.]
MKAHFNKSFNLLFGWLDNIQGKLAVSGSGSEEEISYWREKVLQVLVRTGVVMGFFALLLSVVFLMDAGYWWVALVDTLLYMVIGALMLMRSSSYRLRTFLILGCIYVIGFWVTLTIGFMSGGPVWLFVFAVVAAILLGLRAAVWAILMNVVTLAVVGWLCHQGLAAVGQPFFPTIGRALISGGNFIFLNALVAFSIAAFTGSLHITLAKAHLAQEALRHEIAVRNQIARSLKESEEKYRQLAENMSDILWSLDMDLNLTYTSPAAQALMGWTEEEQKQMGLAGTLTETSLKKIMTSYTQKKAEADASGDYRQSVTQEVDLRRKDGGILHAEVRASFFLGEDGKPIGIFGVTRDISERIRAQREREDLLTKLAQSKKMEAIGLMASGVAHDLNNVLSGIVSYPDLLLLDLPEESPLRRPLETIRATGHKASEIVQDLLTLARRGVQSMEAVCLNEVVQEYLSSPEHVALLKRHPKVVVQTTLADELLPILGSSIHLKKALMNLVINATEAQPQGGTIAVSTTNRHLEPLPQGLEHMAAGDYALLKISDQGTGIAEEDLKRIFEPFFTRKVMGRSGTGLGMSVVWGTVQDHHGAIIVHSKEHQGTTMELYFPVTRQVRREKEQEPATQALMGSGQTILVVDDVSEQREIAADILRRLGYRTVTAPSGEAAIAYLKQQSDGAVDAVVLDMIMDPGMDGLDTYRQIREWDATIKATIASGYAETERVKAALRLGVGAYIKKPYMLKEIGLALKQLLADGGANPSVR